MTTTTKHDPVHTPAHYTHPSGIECKDITYLLPTWLGAAIKYVWRRDKKGQPIQDRQKAIEVLREAIDKRLYLVEIRYTDDEICHAHAPLVAYQNWVKEDEKTRSDEPLDTLIIKVGLDIGNHWRNFYIYLRDTCNDLEREIREIKAQEATEYEGLAQESYALVDTVKHTAMKADSSYKPGPFTYHTSIQNFKNIEKGLNEALRQHKELGKELKKINTSWKGIKGK